MNSEDSSWAHSDSVRRGPESSIDWTIKIIKLILRKWLLRTSGEFKMITRHLHKIGEVKSPVLVAECSFGMDTSHFALSDIQQTAGIGMENC